MDIKEALEWAKGGIFTREYLNEFEPRHKIVKSRRDAFKLKKLWIKEGFITKFKKVGFSDLAREEVYLVYGVRRR